MMKKLLIVLLIFQSCDSQPDSSYQNLKGQWEWIGFYKNNQPQYDTIDVTIENDIAGENLALTNIYIWTDSGTYVHHYQQDQLIDIEQYKQNRISEFIIVKGQKGHVLDYAIDPTDTAKEDPRFTASRTDFTIEGNRINFIDSPATEVFINKLTDRELVLEFKDGISSRFKKYEYEP